MVQAAVIVIDEEALDALVTFAIAEEDHVSAREYIEAAILLAQHTLRCSRRIADAHRMSLANA